MSIITRMQKQRAIWWKRLAPDKYGNFSFDPPIEIACRWDDVNENFIDPRGEQLTTHALVYVDRVMLPGDRLKLGELETDTPDNPLDIDTHDIKRMDINPNFKATEFLRVAYL